ncbi:MAG TPA: H-X9-DG-CTERM domain-containing protein [Pirellulales bacterium]|nr:H-X9-DG-CTERM domain-containing protein [Pirellulales bacterium]
MRSARPSSNHPCGVMVNFCDGHSRFIGEDIDYLVYCKLLTSNDAECNDTGALEPVPADSSNSYQIIRFGGLDESKIN